MDIQDDMRLILTPGNDFEAQEAFFRVLDEMLDRKLRQGQAYQKFSLEFFKAIREEVNRKG